MPKAYFLFEIEITDPIGYEAYRSQAAVIIERCGGRYLIRGGDPKLVEGNDAPGRIVVAEFDSLGQAMLWYNSPEYQAILPIRLRNSTGRAICLTGV
jgi:uncharacterized protein (DUF1330 family)